MNEVVGRVIKSIYSLGGGIGAVFATGSFAIADDLPASFPVKAPVTYVAKAPRLPEVKAYDWNGWYIGANVGVTRGASNWSATQPGSSAPGPNGSFNLPFNFDFMAGTGSYAAGLQGGYNHVFPSRLMLGFELDASFPNSDVVIPYSVRGSQTVTSPFIGQGPTARPSSMMGPLARGQAMRSTIFSSMERAGWPGTMTR
jgi:high affinity Mn2+ porin